MHDKTRKGEEEKGYMNGTPWRSTNWQGKELGKLIIAKFLGEKEGGGEEVDVLMCPYSEERGGFE